jgi:type III restriction enzyme
MKLHFDPSQGYQIDAVSAVVDVFTGQPLMSDGLLSSRRGSFSDLVMGNGLQLAPETIAKNTLEVQRRFKLPVSEMQENLLKDGLNFSVEMETGTGKTYVYLRTIHELHTQYGFNKFVIVVPSLAIKEGVEKNLKITREHFDLLYGKPEMDWHVYDSKLKNQRKRSMIRQFARTSALQILVINIDSFASDDNIVNIEAEDGIAPIQYLAACHPVVIVDEPQNMETDKRKAAIASLNPLCTLRYSATHKYHYNLLYKLDPVKAYDLGLVKKIEVDSVLTRDSFNAAYVEILKVSSAKTKVTAKIRMEAATASGITRKEVTAKVGDNLFALSGNRDVYREGWVIEEIDVSSASVTFTNKQTLTAGQDTGNDREAIQKFQIRRAVLNHLEKEKKLQQHGIKVLTLFFIDQVSNYRQYNEDGSISDGKFAQWFEEAYCEATISRMHDRRRVRDA